MMPPAISNSTSQDESSAAPSVHPYSSKRKLSSVSSELPEKRHTAVTNCCEEYTGIDDLRTLLPQPIKNDFRGSAVGVELPGLAFPKSLYKSEEHVSLGHDERSVLKEILVWS